MYGEVDRVSLQSEDIEFVYSIVENVELAAVVDEIVNFQGVRFIFYYYYKEGRFDDGLSRNNFLIWKN